MLLKAIIFDFDGVIADTEPVHLNAFKQVLKTEDIILEDSEYYSKYLAYDDITFFQRCLNDHGIRREDDYIAELVKRKSLIINELFKQDLHLFPGVRQFIKRKSKDYILAIGSGALRKEIEHILHSFNLTENFRSVVSADEVAKCKPDPEVYIKVLASINQLTTDSKEVTPEECLVIEDSVYGITAAKKAGMNCLAVTNSYAADKLSEADIVIDSFLGFDCDILSSF